MGDREKASLRLQFNPQIRLELHGATITSDAGLLAFRELDDALDLTPIASDYLQESRTGRNIRHHLVPLLRQSIYSRLAGYDDTNDAERLSQDPAMRVVVGWQGSDRNAARTNTMSRFETETLTQEDNLKGLALMNPQWVELAMAHTPHRRVILDMDSSESPVHGQQEGAAYNGHFECVCYHPLFLFNQFGDCEGATLRPGNVHSADGWQELLEPVLLLPSRSYTSIWTGIPQIKPTFLGIAPSGIPSNIIPHSKGIKCGLIRSNAPFSYSNHRPAKPKIPKPLVYAQVSPLGTSFATP